MIKQTSLIHRCGIKLRDRKVSYTLKTSRRAKRIRLAVYCDGRIVVTKPCRIGHNMAEKFILQKAKWILSKLEYFKQFDAKVFKNNRKEYLRHKDKALKFIKKRIKYFNQNYNFKFNKINIKNQKTRWGSCSKKGNLNFSYKILFLPEHIADYIIVHELCHLKEFNHSYKFWNLVAKTVPQYLGIRKELRRKGLHFY
ncbi:MAG: M48 family metallopeptidase [Candidatus Jacksonbacteria bacterium]